MSTLSNPRDLFLQQLAELLWIERTLAHEVIPSAVEAVTDAELKAALSEHLAQTREHVRRVERAFLAARAEPAAARTEVLAPVSREVTEPVLSDYFHAAEAARIEHLELALYDAAVRLAPAEAAEQLAENRRDEEGALVLMELQATRLRDGLAA